MKWQPIETAPRDGTEVLIAGGDVARPMQAMHIFKVPGRGRKKSGWYVAGYQSSYGPKHPTHWMPLPEPPEAA